MKSDEVIRLESKNSILQAQYNVMEENYKEFFDYMNDKYPDETATFFQEAINKTRIIETTKE